jgi:hypothetical protein
MCQEDILKILIEDSKKDITKWFSMIDIEKILIERNYTTMRFNKKVNCLYAFGFLDVIIPKGKGTMYMRRKFRPKEKYILSIENN